MRQIKPAQLAFSTHYNIVILTYLVTIIVAKGAMLSSERQESKQGTNLFTCVRDFMQYAIGYEKNIFCTTVAGSNKTNAC